MLFFPVGEELFWNVPHLDESAILINHISLIVRYQDAIRGRLQLRFKECCPPTKFIFDLLTLQFTLIDFCLLYTSDAADE